MADFNLTKYSVPPRIWLDSNPAPEIQTPCGGVPTNANHLYFGHPMFYEILDEISALHSEKNRQYASHEDPLGNFTRGGRLISKLLKPGINPTLAAALCYVAKQIDGVYEIVGEGKTGTLDSLEDKLKDIAIYAILSICIAREMDRDTNTLVTPL